MECELKVTLKLSFRRFNIVVKNYIFCLLKKCIFLVCFPLFLFKLFFFQFLDELMNFRAQLCRF